MKRTSILVLLVVLAVLAFAGWEWRNSPLLTRLFGSSNEGQLIAQVHYQCDGQKTIDASLYQGPQAPAPQPGQPPTPTGYAQVNLSDGRTMTLEQTLSADGVRYANSDETFVFWSKGNGALVLENNQEKSYIGCIKVVSDPGGLPNVYESASDGFSVRYPANYTVDNKYIAQELGPGISGVKFTIDPAIATGTNLASDSFISVEETGLPPSGCSAKTFFLDPVSVSNYTDGSVTYSYASSTGAGAGNRYEEQVFAIPGTNPCVAVRYFIHYGAIENYPPGMVEEFNHGSLVGQFDAIRKTLIINQ